MIKFKKISLKKCSWSFCMGSLPSMLGVLLDNTTSTAFGHQFSLSLHNSAHFDAVKHGLA
jgi:hypothetical protein